MIPPTAGVVLILAVALLLGGAGSPRGRWILAAQACFVAVAAGAGAWQQGAPLLAAYALATLAIKAVALPLFWPRLFAGSSPYGSTRWPPLWLAIAAFLLASTGLAVAPGGVTAGLGVASLLVGLFGAIAWRGPAAPWLMLLAAENGAAVAASIAPTTVLGFAAVALPLLGLRVLARRRWRSMLQHVLPALSAGLLLTSTLLSPALPLALGGAGLVVLAGLAPLHRPRLTLRARVGPLWALADLLPAVSLAGLIVLTEGVSADLAPPLAWIGVASVWVAAFGLRQSQRRRLPGALVLGQNGLAAIAIGLQVSWLAVPLLVSAPLLGLAAATGLREPARAPLRLICVWAILGLPPSGLFAARAGVMMEAVARAPILAVCVVPALLIGLFALFGRLLAEAPGHVVPVSIASRACAWAGCVLVIVSGLVPLGWMAWGLSWR